MQQLGEMEEEAEAEYQQNKIFYWFKTHFLLQLIFVTFNKCVINNCIAK